MTTTTVSTTKANGRASRSDVTAAVENITPAKAARMLEGNSVNRKLREKRVDLYAKQMLLGQWRVTGESVVLSPDGQLLQGQHRLSACVQSNTSFRTVVVRGVDPEAMTVMDTGMGRTAADVFGFHGVANSAGAAATVRRIISVEGGFALNTTRQNLITRDEMVEFYDRHEATIQQAWQLSGPVYAGLRGSRGAWATLAFLLVRADDDLAAEFFSALASGAGLGEGDARLAFRTWVLNRNISRTNVSWAELVATGIRVWNNWIDGRDVAIVKGWKPANSWPEVAS